MMDILEAMRTRQSVRTFNGECLDSDNLIALKHEIDNVYNPFGGSISIDLKQFDAKGEMKPGTYGVISGARDFMLMACADDEASQLSAGFCLEQVVIKATSMGLGSCWLGATYNASDFSRGISWPHGEKLSIICPVGIPAKRRIVESITRFAFGSKHRKAFCDLFFADRFGNALGEDNSYSEALQMMRLAPSSKNSQPWRCIVAGDVVHFYYKPISRFSVLDTGIGLCHFFLTEKHHNYTGAFYKASDAPETDQGLVYLCSYSRS